MQYCATASFHGYPEHGTRVKVALVGRHGIGKPQTDGASRVTGLTHHVLAEYIGASREIVTGEMNRLRALGYLRYAGGTSMCMRMLLESLRMAGLGSTINSTAITSLQASMSSIGH